MVKVYMFPVGVGDFLWIRFGEGDKTDHNIIIDGGHEKYSGIYSHVLNIIAKSQQTTLIIMTHIDADHIQAAAQGMADFSEDVLNRVVDKIYFNTARGISEALYKRGQDNEQTLSQFIEDKIEVYKNTMNRSVQDAETFMSMIDRKRLKRKLVEYTLSGTEITYGGALLRFISPGESEARNLLSYMGRYKRKEELHYTSGAIPSQVDIDDLKNEKLGNDSSITNRSSFAFIFEYENVKGAFMGDAAAPVICRGLEKLGIKEPYLLDFIKIPHHGGKHNTSDKLLRMLPTQNYLISTEGVPKSGVPSKELIAHMLDINGEVTLYNNFSWWSDAYNDQYFSEQDKTKYCTGQLKLIKLSTKPEIVKEGLELYNFFGQGGI